MDLVKLAVLGEDEKGQRRDEGKQDGFQAVLLLNLVILLGRLHIELAQLNGPVGSCLISLRTSNELIQILGSITLKRDSGHTNMMIPIGLYCF